eukprot:scaffold533_cov369-Prasinococcus_capsulatus_cf.AAC.32
MRRGRHGLMVPVQNRHTTVGVVEQPGGRHVVVAIQAASVVEEHKDCGSVTIAVLHVRVLGRIQLYLKVGIGTAYEAHITAHSRPQLVELLQVRGCPGAGMAIMAAGFSAVVIAP